MKRIILFLATNLAIMIVIGIVFSLLGLTSTLDTQSIGLDLKTLLSMSVVIGVTGSFISLAMSKWSAKRAMNVQVITRPKNYTEQWLFNIVTAQAQKVRIATPEIGIYQAAEANAFATGMSRNHALIAVSWFAGTNEY